MRESVRDPYEDTTPTEGVDKNLDLILKRPALKDKNDLFRNASVNKVEHLKVVSMEYDPLNKDQSKASAPYT